MKRMITTLVLAFGAVVAATAQTTSAQPASAQTTSAQTATTQNTSAQPASAQPATAQTETAAAQNGTINGTTSGTTATQPETPVAIIAHRGFWNCEEGGYSHNSIASLRAAQNAGFAGSEFDINMTKDEQLLVFHDSKIDKKLIEEHPAADFDYYRLPNGEKIPTFDEYLAQFKAVPTCMMVLEIKKHSSAEIENRCVELCLEKLRAEGMLDPSKVMFISFSLNVCETLAHSLPDGFSIQYLTGFKSPEKLNKLGINGIDYHYLIYSVLNPRYPKRAHARGMDVNAWTVNKADTARKLIRKGVNQITTNEPLLMREVVRECGYSEVTRP